MKMFQTEFKQIDKMNLVLDELNKRTNLAKTEDEMVSLAGYMERAHEIMHQMQLNIEHKHKINLTIQEMVEECLEFFVENEMEYFEY